MSFIEWLSSDYMSNDEKVIWGIVVGLVFLFILIYGIRMDNKE